MKKLVVHFPLEMIGNNRIWDLTNSLNMSNNEQIQVKIANGLLSFWLNSNQTSLNMSLLTNYLEVLSKFERQQFLSSAMTPEYCLDLAEKLWELMLDKTNFQVKMSHDAYLKLFHLSRPASFNVNCVMLDEAQDSNDVTLAIVQNIAKSLHKIIVGDIHQTIYQFHGSKNALADFQRIASQTFYLTHSFRFNNTIAVYASSILKYFKAELHTVIGKGSAGEIKVIDGSFQKTTNDVTILARRNATLFEIAIEALKDGKKVHFAGGIAKYDLDLLTSIANLEIGAVVTHPFVKRFKSLNSIESYAENVCEHDILMFVKLVKQNTGKKILAAIKKLLLLDEWVLANPFTNIPLCDYLLTTAHRSKGLEFERVIIADDF